VKYALDTNIFIDGFRNGEAQGGLFEFLNRALPCACGNRRTSCADIRPRFSIAGIRAVLLHAMSDDVVHAEPSIAQEINRKLSRIHPTCAPSCLHVAQAPCRTLRPPVWWLGSHRSRGAKTPASGLWPACLACPIVAGSRWPCAPPVSPSARAPCPAAVGRGRAPVCP